MGILTGAISLFRNISINLIPGSVFTILISTSILFNMLLSYFWLKKAFNKWHVFACIACVLSVLSVGISAFTGNERGSNFSLGISTAIASSLCLAFMTVLQEHLQKDWDDYNHRVIEMSMVASLVASLIVVVTAFSGSEIYRWSTSIHDTAIASLPLVIGISISLPILKMLVRTSKYATIQRSNAFFFEFVQSSGSLVSSVSNILIFNEPWNAVYIVSLFLLALSFGFYIKARLESKRATHLIYVSTDINPIVVATWK